MLRPLPRPGKAVGPACVGADDHQRPSRRPRAAGGSARAHHVQARCRSASARFLLLPGLLLLLAGVGRAFRLPAPYYEHRQPVYAELVTTPQGAPPLPIAAVGINVRVDASPNPGLTTGIAGILQGQLGQRPEELPQVERLLETAAMGMPLATGGEWVLMALAATRLTPAAKASDAGQRFQSALARGLPARLELLEPVELVCLVNGWPRVGLDGLGRHVIQAVVEACIQRLDAFAPAELAQLVRGLCRPVTVRDWLDFDSPHINVTWFSIQTLNLHPHPPAQSRTRASRRSGPSTPWPRRCRTSTSAPGSSRPPSRC